MKPNHHQIKIESVSAALTWPLRQQVMYPDFLIEQVKLKDDELGRHFGLFMGDELCGVISVFVRGQLLQFRKLAIKTASQHQGLGSALLSFVLEKASAENIKMVWCNARLSAADFYIRFGFEQTGLSWQQDGHEFIVMQKTL